MDMAEVKAFNAELSGLYDNKPPISKAKMSAITRGAIKAIKFYKHVVHSVEKFIQKCKPEYKVPGLYVIDSIVRQSRHQFGQDKDVFAPRFAKNMQQTFSNLFRCPPEDKRNIIRVLNLWQKNNVFSSEVIQPLLDMADPNHPLHQEIQAQQNNAANGSSLNISHNTTDRSPGAAQHTPHGSTPMGDSFQDQPSGIPVGSKLTRKLLNDFEYDSEDEPPPPEPAPSQQQQHNNNNPADALGSILTNPEIMRQLQSLQAQMQMMTGMQIPNLMPMMSDMQLQQNQSQNPYMNAQQEQPKMEIKDDPTNESDIEFVETGPQVIEIPDANDSRSPSPKSRRVRSRSRSRSRRRRSRSRSRSPRRRRDRDRDREKDREKEREKSYKEREADRERQKEREKKGLPPIKKENLSVCSTTLWIGHLSKLATQEELSDLFGAIGGVVSIDVVPPRGCAFVVMERRRDAYKALQKLNKHKLHSKEIAVAWAPGKGVKGREWKDYWEADLGVSYLPWSGLHARWLLGALSVDALEDGGAIDEETLPPWLPPRILPKMDSIPMLGMPGPGPGMMPAMPGSMPALPGGMPGSMPPASLPGMLPAAPPGNMPLQVPRLPPPGMGAGMPPGLMRGDLGGVGGVGGNAAPLLGFPPGMPPHNMPQPGMVGGFLGGLLGVGGLVAGMPLQLHQQQQQMQQQQQQHQPHVRTTEVSQADDVMDLDTEDNHEDNNQQQNSNSNAPPPLLSDQLQALLSKPPPTFNASEPPPGFNANEPPPFNANQPPPEDKDDDRKDRDRDRRDRDRRDRDRDGRRDRGGDRDRRDRGGDRERGRDDRREGRDRDREDRRDRDRDRGGRDRRDDRNRDRDRDRDRDRFSSRENTEQRSREKSPRAAQTNEQSSEKSLQERLWEMANGKPPPREEPQENTQERGDRGERGESRENREDNVRMDRPPPLIDRPPNMDNVPEEAPQGGAESGWTALPPRPPPHLAAPFRAELRMRGPPRQPMRGPWMEGPPGGPPGPPGPPFGPRFNGMPPFNRPPFERPPFDGPMFDGPPRFERPPFNRMPFDAMNRPPFDGPRPPFEGPRPPFEPRPNFDGPRQFEPPFEGERFDGPRFDGPPEFFDRNNRRFDEREQFNERGWNGDRDRDRDWDRRNEWDDRRRDRRPRDDDRFRDRNDRRRNFEDRRNSRDDRPSREDRNSSAKDDVKEKSVPREEKSAPKEEKSTREERNTRRDKDRKSRWGAAEETTTSENNETAQEQMIAEILNNSESRPSNEANETANKDAEVSSQVGFINEPNASENITERNEVKQSMPQDNFNQGDSFERENAHKNTETQERKELDFTQEKSLSDFDLPEKSVSNNDNEKQYQPQDTEFSKQDINEYDTQKDTSYREPENESVAPVEIVPKDVPMSLYDTNEAIDTSFSAAPLENNVEKESKFEESSKSDDIFETKAEAATVGETSAVENKEGVA